VKDLEAAEFLSRAVKGNALVADDVSVHRLMLSEVLSELGYQVFSAADGQQALTLFKQHSIDIVFLDVHMPVMDGYQAASEIKRLSGSRFIPVIFVTALNEVDASVKCIACGGDDILFKPIEHAVLKAKALGFERIKAVHQKISLLETQRQQEEILAERILSGAVANSQCADQELLIWLNSASTFSGDVVFAEYRPNGDIYALLGDFTGHGLRAAIGAMPVAEVFRSMTRKGYSAEALLQQINRRLHRLLPTGMFLAATFVELSFQQRSIGVWNGGMPDLLIVDGVGDTLRQRVPASSIALGIQAQLDIHLTTLEWTVNDHILLFSDGILDAVNLAGEMFGEARLLQAITDKAEQISYIASVQKHLSAFCQGAEQADDISLVEIPNLLARPHPKQSEAYAARPLAKAQWQWQIELDVLSLKSLNPVPLFMNTLDELKVNQVDRNTLFTVVGELFNNAFEHGVLQLDSSIKHSADGFEEYYRLRKQRVEQLNQGWVKLAIRYDGSSEVGQFTIDIADSGTGFDEALVTGQAKPSHYYGRGLHIVRSLCQQLSFSQSGSKVTAVYCCQSE